MLQMPQTANDSYKEVKSTLDVFYCLITELKDILTLHI